MTTQPVLIAENIRGWRGRKKLTQQSIADALSVHRNTVASWENGESEVPFNKACALADLFGCSLDELAGRNE